MALYPKIDNESILLDMDCKRLLKRVSRQNIIYEVMYKIKKENIDNTIDNTIDKTIDNRIDKTIDKTIDNTIDNTSRSFYEKILMILACNIKDL